MELYRIHSASQIIGVKEPVLYVGDPLWMETFAKYNENDLEK